MPTVVFEHADGGKLWLLWPGSGGPAAGPSGESLAIWDGLAALCHCESYVNQTQPTKRSGGPDVASTARGVGTTVCSLKPNAMFWQRGRAAGRRFWRQAACAAAAAYLLLAATCLRVDMGILRRLRLCLLFHSSAKFDSVAAAGPSLCLLPGMRCIRRFVARHGADWGNVLCISGSRVDGPLHHGQRFCALILWPGLRPTKIRNHSARGKPAHNQNN